MNVVIEINLERATDEDDGELDASQVGSLYETNEEAIRQAVEDAVFGLEVEGEDEDGVQVTLHIDCGTPWVEHPERIHSQDRALMESLWAGLGDGATSDALARVLVGRGICAVCTASVGEPVPSSSCTSGTHVPGPAS